MARFTMVATDRAIPVQFHMGRREGDWDDWSILSKGLCRPAANEQGQFGRTPLMANPDAR